MLLSNDCYLKSRCYKHLKNVAIKHNIPLTTKIDASGKQVLFTDAELTLIHNNLLDEELECNGSAHYCPKLFKLDYLYSEALLSPKQRQHIDLYLDADGSDREAYTRLSEIESTIETFVANGENLFIYSSNTGNGKTEWSLRLLRAYLDKIWHKSDLNCRALFINVPRLLLALKNNISETDEYAEHIKREILSADIVVFDEVATKCFSSFEHEHILSMINARLDMGKSNIYTSNLTGDELRSRIGDRLYSRVVNASITIEFVGQDKRCFRNGVMGV